MIGYCALVVLGFNVTKRYYTLPHAHKDESKAMLMYNGELHPYEFNQPKVQRINVKDHFRRCLRRTFFQNLRILNGTKNI